LSTVKTLTKNIDFDIKPLRTAWILNFWVQGREVVKAKIAGRIVIEIAGTIELKRRRNV
jgi:hypothetical protein